jgi:hypothetical protein
VPYRSDELARLFASALAVAAFAAACSASASRCDRTPMAYLYAGGAIGVALPATS